MNYYVYIINRMPRYVKSKDLSPEALKERRAKDAERKRLQRQNESNGIVAQTYRRRKYVIQQRQQSELTSLDQEHQRDIEYFKTCRNLQNIDFNDEENIFIIGRHCLRQYRRLQREQKIKLKAKKLQHRVQIKSFQRIRKIIETEPQAIERINEEHRIFLETMVRLSS